MLSPPLPITDQILPSINNPAKGLHNALTASKKHELYDGPERIRVSTATVGRSPELATAHRYGSTRYGSAFC